MEWTSPSLPPTLPGKGFGDYGVLASPDLSCEWALSPISYKGKE